jgi:hypothetical protein
MKGSTTMSDRVLVVSASTHIARAGIGYRACGPSLVRRPRATVLTPVIVDEVRTGGGRRHARRSVAVWAA